MKKLLVLILIAVLCASQETDKQVSDLTMRVGQIVPGRIDPEVSNQKVHPIYIEKIEKKFMFIRLSTFETNAAAIGLYENMTGQLLYSCMDNSYDTCYIPSTVLTPNK